MTVPVQSPVANHTGNGVTTSFAYGFKLLDEDDLIVVVNSIEKTLGVDYTVSGVGVEGGGTVAFTVAPTVLAEVSLTRRVAINRLTDYQYSGDFQSPTVNHDFDRIVMMIQDSGIALANAVRLPPGDPSSGLLPSAGSRALMNLGFNAEGTLSLVPATAGDATALALALASAALPTQGTGLVGYKPSLTGAVTRTLTGKLSDVVSVKDFDAVGDGIVLDTNAFTLAAAAVSDDGTILVPPGLYNIGAIPSTKKLVWSAEGAFAPDGVTPLTLPGVVRQSRGGASNGRLETLLLSGSTGTDFAVEHVQRNATHAGGAVGYVNSGFRVDSYVDAGVTNFEWAIVGRVVNTATAGENVGIYGQGIKQSTGPTWGMVAEAIDSTAIPNPATGLVGLEVDISANGTDTNFNRIGIDVVTRRQNPVGATSEGGVGLRIGSGGSLVEGNWKTAIKIADTVTVGIDMSTTTFTAGGYALRLKTNAPIDFSGDGLNQVYWNGSDLVYASSGATKLSINATGDLSVAQTLTLRGNVIFHGSFATGAQTATLGTNKPGAAGGPPSTWLSYFINGVQHWVPAWTS